MEGEKYMNSEPSGCYIIDDDYNIISVNKAGRRIYPQRQRGRKCYECLMGLNEPCGPCPVHAHVEGPHTYVDPIRHISEMVDKVDFELEGTGPCHALVFSTVESEEAFAATLPTSQRGLRDLALIKALTSDYYDVFSVRMSDQSTRLFRHNSQPVETAEDNSQIYSEVNERYISHYVLPEDREEMRENSRLENIIELLRKSESVTLHYRVLLNGELHYFYRKNVRIGNAEDFEHIVIGVACEDEIMLSLERNRELQAHISLMEYDTETTLLTKEAFFIRASHLLDEYTDRQFDLCILKLENLGLINHQYGTAAGDRLIRLIGHLLKAYESDTMCIAYMSNGVFVSISEA